MRYFDFVVRYFDFVVRYFGFAVRYFDFAVRYFGFVVRYFDFAVRYFDFVVRYFGFAVRFSVLPLGFWFCRDSCGPLYFLPPGKNLVLSSRNIGQINYQPLAVRSALPLILSVILYCRS